MNLNLSGLKRNKRPEPTVKWLIEVLAVDAVVIAMMYLNGGLINLDVIIKMIFVIQQIFKIFWVN